ALLRRAYRTLKDELSSDLFDFTLPFSARVNLTAADRVIDRAKQLAGHLPCHPDDWNKSAVQYMRVWYSCYLKPNMKRTNREMQFASLIQRATARTNNDTAVPQKLQRRLRSFEFLRPSLDPQSASRYAAALTADFTSSDDGGDDEELTNNGDCEVALPRPLAWESAELRGFKEKLDATYADNLADPDERRRLAAQLLARRRQQLVLSSRRAPPPGGPDWAIDGSADATAGADAGPSGGRQSPVSKDSPATAAKALLQSSFRCQRCCVRLNLDATLRGLDREAVQATINTFQSRSVAMLEEELACMRRYLEHLTLAGTDGRNRRFDNDASEVSADPADDADTDHDDEEAALARLEAEEAELRAELESTGAELAEVRAEADAEEAKKSALTAEHQQLQHAYSELKRQLFLLDEELSATRNQQRCCPSQKASPVSGTIIRALSKSTRSRRARPTSQAAQLDIVTTFNFVEVTPEAEAALSKIVNRIGEFVCQLCWVTFGDAFQLAQHRCPCIEYEEYRCSDCGKLFNCSANLASHRRWHKPKPDVAISGRKCSSSGLQFSIDAILRPDCRAVKTKEAANKQFACRSCGRGFKRSAYLRKHQQGGCGACGNSGTAGAGEQWQCEVCGGHQLGGWFSIIHFWRPHRPHGLLVATPFVAALQPVQPLVCTGQPAAVGGTGKEAFGQVNSYFDASSSDSLNAEGQAKRRHQQAESASSEVLPQPEGHSAAQSSALCRSRGCAVKICQSDWRVRLPAVLGDLRRRVPAGSAIEYEEYRCSDCGKLFNSTRSLISAASGLQFSITLLKQFACRSCGRGFKRSAYLHQHSTLESRGWFQISISHQLGGWFSIIHFWRPHRPHGLLVATPVRSLCKQSASVRQVLNGIEE
uniref:C2H2-type domain-containing protein n=1 Tax=Macrostomum lignano TaxID=282301 RepID=A0A1I8IRJ8_9PLAT